MQIHLTKEGHLMDWYSDLVPHLNLWNRIRTERKKKKKQRDQR